MTLPSDILTAETQTFIDDYGWHGTFLALYFVLDAEDPLRAIILKCILITEPTPNMVGLITHYGKDQVIKSLLINATDSVKPCPTEAVKLLKRERGGI